MLINLDYKKRESIYEQIIHEIERYVALGILKPNEKIPSVRVMATDLGINPNTVKKAYDILEEKGVIETLSTKGTFITENTQFVKKEKCDSILLKIEECIGELEKLGMKREEIMKLIQKG